MKMIIREKRLDDRDIQMATEIGFNASEKTALMFGKERVKWLINRLISISIQLADKREWGRSAAYRMAALEWTSIARKCMR